MSAHFNPTRVMAAFVAGIHAETLRRLCKTHVDFH